MKGTYFGVCACRFSCRFITRTAGVVSTFLERVSRAIPSTRERPCAHCQRLVNPPASSILFRRCSFVLLSVTWYEHPRAGWKRTTTSPLGKNCDSRRSKSNSERAKAKGPMCCMHLPVGCGDIVLDRDTDTTAPPYSWTSYGRSSLKTRRYARGVLSSVGIRGQSDIRD